MAFQPGQSGNPGGRPKGLATRVREQTRDGQAIVDLMLKVFRGRTGKQTRLADRIEAGKWLADRGWGKPTHAVTGQDGDALVIRLIRWAEEEGDPEKTRADPERLRRSRPEG